MSAIGTYPPQIIITSIYQMLAYSFIVTAST
jgi:hypothetical protein